MAKPGHDAECAQRIRMLRLARAANPPPITLLHAIAAEISQCCGHHSLKCFRLASGWSSAEKAVQAMRRMCDEQGLGSRGLTKRSWLDWESGHRPGADYLDLLCRLFRTGPVELGFATDYTPGLRTTAPALERELIMSAASESSDHAAETEAAAIGPNALEQLSEDVTRLARAYVHAPPLPLFGELTRVRNRVYRLIDRTRRPAQQRDLYLVAGQVCGLLGSASFDLGYAYAASEQARAARVYGEVIGHNELTAWADGLLACVEFWAGRPAQALQLVERGLTIAPEGTTRVRLLSIAARASALLGDVDGTRQAILDAQDARGPQTELHDGVGGEFGFDGARQSFCAGSSYLSVGLGMEAAAECERALALYRSAPAEHRWYAAEASTSVDLAAARLLAGDIDGVTEALTPVFPLSPDRRVEGILKRVKAIRNSLATISAQDTTALMDMIEGFTIETAAYGLPISL
ncbi:XRE family transcriptional regulator [Sphaerisporangium sp. NPDC049003]|uniref:XRE family transcriptional regulator n=1 Tax=Sphaerisporangium sp. NPDC049003 TaxID=3364517 RepID=UPI00371E26C5